MRLEELETERAFALVAPGYSPGETRWSLLKGLRPVRPDERPDHSVWLAAYEQPGARAVQLTGVFERVDVEWGPASAVTWSLDDTGYVDQVETIRRAIADGDVYQVNLTCRAAVTAPSGAALLAALCRRGTPRFAAWVRAPDHGGEFVSASPELLCEVDGRTIRAEPMKGTAPAGARDVLSASDKDHAELAMITDLLRDDLHHLCERGSVRVLDERRFIELPYAVQTVSDIEGRLREGVTLRDVFAQLHPGGSVTGAPREAARGLINRLESTPRGWYCGFLGWQCGAVVRAALLIRTAQRLEGAASWRYGVGGGITWHSVPNSELAELQVKLGALS